MKAMVLKAANTPFILETLPDPEPGPGEAVAPIIDAQRAKFGGGLFGHLG